MKLEDSCGRPLLNLRLAVTRACNLHCQYCHMEGEEKQGASSPSEMTPDEILRIVRIAVDLGISKVKLTGGEPLIRKDILEIVAGIAVIPGIMDLSMTTNGTMLAPLAKDLHQGGLKRVNISLPSLDPATFYSLTGGRVSDVVEGVKAAVKAGLNPVKLNMIILECVSNYDFAAMMRFAAEAGAVLQLIELEPVNISREYFSANHRSLDEYEYVLKEKALQVETRPYMQNRHIYHLPDVKVEVIHPIENTEFCQHCTRLRVTSNGKLKPCLMRNDNLVDILTPLRNGARDEELVELIRLANQRRQPYNN